MSLELYQKRQKIHQKVIHRMAEMVATLTVFVIIFATLLLVSNWPAYSLIIQDWIDPMETASVIEVPGSRNQSERTFVRASQIPNQFIIPNSQSQAENLFSLSDLGELYPDEMRLEVPKVFEGTIPVQEVQAADFNFADLYNSEKKIQEGLKDGVVHYPYTANPDQYGNVFITGHSSYYPWDKGEYREIFALLYKLDIGDQYFIYYKGKKYSYQISEIFEIQPDDISVLAQPEDQKISTLMTCTPIGTVLRRLIVRAELVQIQ